MSDDLCYYCFRPDPDTIDHKIPLSRGGKRSKANEVRACVACNGAKGQLTDYEYLRLRGNSSMLSAAKVVVQNYHIVSAFPGGQVPPRFEFERLVREASVIARQRKAKEERKVRDRERKRLKQQLADERAMEACLENFCV